jgi:hypothetical protein
MSVNMAQVVDQQFQETTFTPPKLTVALSRFVGESLNRRLAFLATIFEIV